MPDAFTSVAIRTPISCFGGALANRRPDDLAAPQESVRVGGTMLSRQRGSASAKAFRWYSNGSDRYSVSFATHIEAVAFYSSA